MGAFERTSEGRLIEPFPIHFDVPGHEIPLATFIETAKQAEAVVSSLNREFFDGKLQYDFVVLPPDDGTFLSRLGIVMLAGWGVVWAFSDTDIGKGFIKGLTTQEPGYWAEIAGERVRQSLLSAQDDVESIEASDTAEDATDPGGFQCRYGAVIVAEATRSFLQKSSSELSGIGLTTSRFRDAYEAKNQFYQSCSETEGLQAIGFDESPTFPIPRSAFASLQVALPPEEEEDDLWQTGTVILKVTSPNWDRDDKQRQWKGRDSQNHERFFKIEDEHFWALVKADRLNPHFIDTIKVQWAYRGKPETPRSCRVLKVVEFNGTILSPPLDDNALMSILGSYEEAPVEQGDLFERN